MAKLLLMSVIAGTVLIPALAARHPDARRGLRLMLRNMALMTFIYMLALRFIWPRLN